MYNLLSIRQHLNGFVFKVYSIGLDYFGVGKLSDAKEVINQLLKMHQRSLMVKRMVSGQTLYMAGYLQDVFFRLKFFTFFKTKT